MDAHELIGCFLSQLGTKTALHKGLSELIIAKMGEQNKCKWVFLGWGVKFLEPLRSVLEREIREEKGLDLDARFFSKEEVRSIIKRGWPTEIVSVVLKDIGGV